MDAAYSEGIKDEEDPQPLERLVPKEVRSCGRIYRRAAHRPTPRDYRPEPPVGWKSCLTACLYRALVARLGVGDEDRDRICFENRSRTEARPDWVVLSGWLKNKRKCVKSFEGVRMPKPGEEGEGTSKYVVVGPHDFFPRPSGGLGDEP